MSQFGPVACYECGSIIDDYYPVFCKMRSLVVSLNKEVHINKAMLKSNSEGGELNVVFLALGIPPERYCCRKILMCTKTPEDLENI